MTVTVLAMTVAVHLSMVASLPTLNLPMGSEAAYSSAFQAFWELYNTYPEVQAEYKDFKLLWPFTLEPYALVSRKKEVHLPADLQGLRVGGVGFAANLLSANGAAPVNMTSPDAYTNLDKGIVAQLCFLLADRVLALMGCLRTYSVLGGTLIILMGWRPGMPCQQTSRYL
jgi:TRAP-type C4-dicarboxylate transport system substrate-binding protein